MLKIIRAALLISFETVSGYKKAAIHYHLWDSKLIESLSFSFPARKEDVLPIVVVLLNLEVSMIGLRISKRSSVQSTLRQNNASETKGFYNEDI